MKLRSVMATVGAFRAVTFQLIAKIPPARAADSVRVRSTIVSPQVTRTGFSPRASSSARMVESSRRCRPTAAVHVRVGALLIQKRMARSAIDFLVGELFSRNGNIRALLRVYRHMSLETTKEYRWAHVRGAPGLMAVRTGELKCLLGASTVSFRRGIKQLVIIDTSLTLQGVAHDWES
jgi:hypothetical protein